MFLCRMVHGAESIVCYFHWDFSMHRASSPSKRLKYSPLLFFNLSLHHPLKHPTQLSNLTIHHVFHNDSCTLIATITTRAHRTKSAIAPVLADPSHPLALKELPFTPGQLAETAETLNGCVQMCQTVSGISDREPGFFKTLPGRMMVMTMEAVVPRLDVLEERFCVNEGKVQ